MKKIGIIIIFILYILKKDLVVISALEALNIWAKNIFPILFPTFIISDLLLSSGIVNDISEKLGTIFKKIFNTSQYGLYIFIISLISGTPTNAKNLKSLYDNHLITQEDITKILNMCIFFNPFLIINLAGFKILIILWISNILTGIILRNKNRSTNIEFRKINIEFNLAKSIENNINILLNILGTITIYMVLANIIPAINIQFKTLVSGILEVTNGLNKTNLYFKGSNLKEYFNIIFLSFGGISIHTQIKSILKDTKINYKSFIMSRLLTACVGIIICANT